MGVLVGRKREHSPEPTKARKWASASTVAAAKPEAESPSHVNIEVHQYGSVQSASALVEIPAEAKDFLRGLPHVRPVARRLAWLLTIGLWQPDVKVKVNKDFSLEHMVYNHLRSFEFIERLEIDHVKMGVRDDALSGSG